MPTCNLTFRLIKNVLVSLAYSFIYNFIYLYLKKYLVRCIYLEILKLHINLYRCVSRLFVVLSNTVLELLNVNWLSFSIRMYLGLHIFHSQNIIVRLLLFKLNYNWFSLIQLCCYHLLYGCFSKSLKASTNKCIFVIRGLAVSSLYISY